MEEREDLLIFDLLVSAQNPDILQEIHLTGHYHACTCVA